MNPIRPLGFALLGPALSSLVLLGCGNKVSLENYQKIQVGMAYAEVVQLIGKPENCNEVIGVRNCTWGDKTSGVNVSFVSDKALLFASRNLK